MSNKIDFDTATRQVIRVLLFIGELNMGGAERQFVALARNLSERGIAVAVMLNKSGGEFQQELEQAGIQCHDLKMQGITSLFGYVLRARKVINTFKPSIVYGFMGSGIKASLLTLLDHNIKVIWGIRSALTEHYYKQNKLRIASFIDRLCSPMPAALICNSQAGAEAIKQRGFRNSCIRIVYNGIDTQRFNFNTEQRKIYRELWDVNDSDVVIGMVARLHPDKNHTNALYAISTIIARNPNVKLVLIGAGEDEYVSNLKALAEQLGIAECIVWAGPHKNTAEVYSAFDLQVSSSSTEAFPNVVAEAMAVGLPVVASDVGDCREIIGDKGWIVYPNNSNALAESLDKAIASLSQWHKQSVRQHVIDNYSINQMAEKTLAVFKEVCEQERRI